METLDLSGEYTGRYLVVGKPGTATETVKEIREATGLSLKSSTDFENEEISLADIEDGDGIFFDKIGVAVVNATSAEQIQSLNEIAVAAQNGDSEENQVVIEPERVCHAIDENWGDYLKGYKDAVNHLADKYKNTDEQEGDEIYNPEQKEDVGAAAINATYGLIKTRVSVTFPYRQNYSGSGIKVAVLDTGMDLNHPDFAGRTIIHRSFVPGQAVQDLHSHGTHCIGTACGPLKPTDPSKPRYGIAYKSVIYVGKVLNNSGSGADGWILAGINWAVANRCHVISMSLGAPVSAPGYSAAYEAAAKAALNAGCLIVAAAGNDSRYGLRPVGHPANCPSIMAVGAVGENLKRADFSNVTFYPPYGKVDISGPGVNTFSSVPMPTKYGYKSGTSMATPHVAGIAALHAQKSAAYRGAALWARLTSTAMALSESSAHIGAGLTQAPYSRILIDFPPVIPFPPIFERPPVIVKPPIPIPDPGPIQPIKKISKSKKPAKLQ